jgi:transcriptional regulator with XRE-family HTH domain
MRLVFKGDRMITFFIKEKRLEKNLSIEKLAKLSGVSKSFISEIERGDKVPGIETLCKLGFALKCELTELFVFKPQKREYI